MYTMILGDYPFDGETRDDIKEVILNREVNFEEKKR